MKVRHIRHKPWLRKGPAYRSWKKWLRSQRRQAAYRRALIEEACRRYMRPVFMPSASHAFEIEVESAPAPLAGNQ